ncbi:MAG: chorismate synthase [Flavobacteriales bacterium]|nr:chorismate synthase [Flavobacteriales bacterium]
MAGNTFGNIFRLTTYGESHGVSIGGIIDGCPAGLPIDMEAIQSDLDRRKPGQSEIVTQRKEDDKVKFLSGIFDGMTTGTPIAFQIENENQKSKDYSEIKDQFRPSHADYTYHKKYGVRDYRGGGRSSARETASRVVAGAIAKQVLSKYGICITAYVSAVGPHELSKSYLEMNLAIAEQNEVRIPDEVFAKSMVDYIKSIRKAGDSIGGQITCIAKGVPVGLGAPVFDKLHADLGKAMLSINAVKGFEYGSGFSGSAMKGSEHNDAINLVDDKIATDSNWSGGIQGGISNGEDIYFNVGFKPVATIMQDQNSIDTKGNEVKVVGKGRHDPCVVPRAVPIVEAMAALVLVDHLLRNRTVKL